MMSFSLEGTPGAWCRGDRRRQWGLRQFSPGTGALITVSSRRPPFFINKHLPPAAARTGERKNEEPAIEPIGPRARIKILPRWGGVC